MTANRRDRTLPAAGEMDDQVETRAVSGLGMPWYELMGVRVQAYTMDDLHAAIERAIRRDHRIVIANHNLNSIYLQQRSEPMQRFFDQADIIHIDSMPLLLWGKLLGYDFQRAHRVTYVDWVHPLMAKAEQHEWRVFYLGSKPGVAEQGAEILRTRYPRLQIMTRHGYFDASVGSADNAEILKTMAEFRPHLLFVGMSMPRQELWILDHLHTLPANVILPCGATIDYISGVIPAPPRWMGRLGFEWSYRLATEPRRLARRYLIEPWSLSGVLLHDIWRRLTGLL